MCIGSTFAEAISYISITTIKSPITGKLKTDSTINNVINNDSETYLYHNFRVNN